MSIEQVTAYFTAQGMAERVLVFDASCATVALAAAAVGTSEGQIAKSLGFYGEAGGILVVAAGDAKVDNKKFRHVFGIKAKMLTPEDVFRYTGHQVGGVSPFAIDRADLKIYLDVSLQRFDIVYPSAGSANSMVRLSVEELVTYSQAEGFVDVCKDYV